MTPGCVSTVGYTTACGGKSIDYPWTHSSKRAASAKNTATTKPLLSPLENLFFAVPRPWLTMPMHAWRGAPCAPPDPCFPESEYVEIKRVKQSLRRSSQDTNYATLSRCATNTGFVKLVPRCSTHRTNASKTICLQKALEFAIICDGAS